VVISKSGEEVKVKWYSGREWDPEEYTAQYAKLQKMYEDAGYEVQNVSLANGLRIRDKWREVKKVDISNIDHTTKEIRAEFDEGLNKKGASFVNKGGSSVHPHAQTQYGKAGQAKANIVAELSDRLNQPDDRRLFEKFRGRAFQSDREYEAQLQHSVNQVIARWAQSSGDDHPTSLVIQQAIKDEFGLKGNVYAASRYPSEEYRARVKRETEALYLQEGPFLRRLVREMYNHTQEEFQRAGIQEVSLYRGMHNIGRELTYDERMAMRNAGGLKTHIQLQPANSWSTSAKEARKFGTYIQRGTVPVERVIGTARTGFGCLNEKEWVMFETDGEIMLTYGAAY